jgi:cytochrome bd-type quinol oxidase subunit 2
VITATRLRQWITWLFFLGGLLAALLTASYIPKIARTYGPQFPESPLAQLPAFSASFISHVAAIVWGLYALVGAAILAAILIARREAGAETRAHEISLVTLVVYHVVLVVWVGFVVAYFWLPKLNAGI